MRPTEPKRNKGQLTDEQRRTRALFDSELGKSVLREWQKITSRPKRPTLEDTYFALGQQAWVQDITDLIDYKEPK